MGARETRGLAGGRARAGRRRGESRMEMTGERRIEAPRGRVWDALNDPEALKAAIPGCESVERTGPDSFEAKVAMRIGPMSAKFGGKVKLSNVVPPESYTITGEGSGGAMGFAKGGADVSLSEQGADATLLRYAVKAQVGGKMAQLGARLIDSTAKQMADQFFDRFAKNLAPVEAPAAEPVMATAGDAPAEAVVVGRSSAHGGHARDAADPGVPTGGRAEEVVPVAETPLAAAPSLLSRGMALLAKVPSDVLGLPILFWIGTGAWLAILALMFLG